VGTKSSGFFLYRATRISSTGRCLSRPSVWLDVPASARSIRSLPLPARDGLGGSEPQNVCRSVSRCAAESTNPLRIPPLEVLAPATATASSSAVTPTAADGRTPAWPAGPWPRLFENFVPNAPRSLWRSSRLRLRTDRSCRPEAAPRRDVGAIRVRGGFPGVSCSIG